MAIATVGLVAWSLLLGYGGRGYVVIAVALACSPAHTRRTHWSQAAYHVHVTMVGYWLMAVVNSTTVDLRRNAS